MVKELLHLARVGSRHPSLNASCIYFTIREAVDNTQRFTLDYVNVQEHAASRHSIK